MTYTVYGIDRIKSNKIKTLLLFFYIAVMCIVQVYPFNHAFPPTQRVHDGIEAEMKKHALKHFVNAASDYRLPSCRASG